MQRETGERIIYKADTRGGFDFGWLKTYHTFSFGHYFDPQRIHFGALRVLNDDTIQPGTGFGTHPHENMEIVSIPLRGALAHKDSMGHEQTLKVGEVQAMSAGTGITHSEYNASQSEEASFLQIWVMPEKQNVTPRYAQRAFSFKKNEWTVVVSPDGDDADGATGKPLSINQSARFLLGEFDGGHQLTLARADKRHGFYLFVIEGSVALDDEVLRRRDGAGIAGDLSIQVEEGSHLLLVEVPL